MVNAKLLDFFTQKIAHGFRAVLITAGLNQFIKFLDQIFFQ